MCELLWTGLEPHPRPTPVWVAAPFGGDVGGGWRSGLCVDTCRRTSSNLTFRTFQGCSVIGRGVNAVGRRSSSWEREGPVSRRWRERPGACPSYLPLNCRSSSTVRGVGRRARAAARSGLCPGGGGVGGSTRPTTTRPDCLYAHLLGRSPRTSCKKLNGLSTYRMSTRKRVALELAPASPGQWPDDAARDWQDGAGDLRHVSPGLACRCTDGAS